MKQKQAEENLKRKFKNLKRQERLSMQVSNK